MSPSWASLGVQMGLKQRRMQQELRAPELHQHRAPRDTLTEPLKERKSLRSTSSEKGGCRATRLMKRFRALRRPSMNSLSAGGEYRVTTDLAEHSLRAGFQAPPQRLRTEGNRAPPPSPQIRMGAGMAQTIHFNGEHWEVGCGGTHSCF